MTQGSVDAHAHDLETYHGTGISVTAEVGRKYPIAMDLGI